MKFGICRCCSITGIYDIYGLYGPIRTHIDPDSFTYDHNPDFLFYRTSSIQEFTPITQSNINNSIPDGWYIDYRTADRINKGIPNLAIAPISNTNERVWIRRKDGESSRYYGQSGESGQNQLFKPYDNIGTGWATGFNATIVNNRLMSISGGLSSGVYMERYVPHYFYEIDPIFDPGVYDYIPHEMFVQYEKDYDKAILLTLTNWSTTDGWHIWFGNGIRNRKISGVAEFQPTSNKYDINDAYIVRIGSMHEDLDQPPHSSSGHVKFQLVDGTGLFTLNDVAGYGIDINSISMNYIGAVQAYGDTPFINDISLVDVENKQVLLYHDMNDYYLSKDIYLSDMAKYLCVSGDFLSENDIANYDDKIKYYFGNLDYMALGSINHTNNILNDSVNSAYYFVNKSGYVGAVGLNGNAVNSLAAIDSDGRKIAFINSPEPYTYYINSLDDVALPFQYRSVDRYVVDNTGILSSDDYTLICEIDSSGSSGMSSSGIRQVYYGETANWGMIEYPTFMTGLYNGAEFRQLYTPIDNGINLPRINMWTAKDYPNCFSVLQPKYSLVQSTGQGSVCNYHQKHMLNHEVKILYGPFVQNTYPVYMQGGEHGTYPQNQFATGGHPDGINRIVRPNRTIIHGNTGSPVFWSDSYSQEQVFDIFANISGDIYPTVCQVETGLLLSHQFTNVAANVIWGDCKNNIPAAIFTHSRINNYITETLPNISGSGYSQTQTGITHIKVKIGDNIVFNQQVFDSPELYGCFTKTDFDNTSGMCLHMARGLTAIKDSESAQSNTGVSGIGFAWFERLWHTMPNSGHLGIPTGWRLHVTDMSGNDLWKMDTAGNYKYPSGTGSPTGTGLVTGALSGWLYHNLGIPTIMASSDRFIYVNGFFLCDNRVGNINHDPEFYDDDCYNSILAGNYSGAGYSWAITHDGLNKFPITLKTTATTQHNAVLLYRPRDNTLPLNTMFRKHLFPNQASIFDESFISVVDLTMGNDDNDANNNFALCIDSVKNNDKISITQSYNQYGQSSCPSGQPIYYSPYLPTGMFLGTGCI